MCWEHEMQTITLLKIADTATFFEKQGFTQ